jgi:hypothetical protein
MQSHWQVQPIGWKMKSKPRKAAHGLAPRAGGGHGRNRRGVTSPRARAEAAPRFKERAQRRARCLPRVCPRQGRLGRSPARTAARGDGGVVRCQERPQAAHARPAAGARVLKLLVERYEAVGRALERRRKYGGNPIIRWRGARSLGGGGEAGWRAGRQGSGRSEGSGERPPATAKCEAVLVPPLSVRERSGGANA